MTVFNIPDNLLAPPLAAMKELEFRLVQRGDIRELQETCYGNQRPARFWDHSEQMIVWQENGRACWLLIKHRDRLVGSGELLIYPHTAELANLFVIPAYRRRGIGTALIIILCRIARHLDITGLDLSVGEQNHLAQKLYRRLGFANWKKNELPGGETAVIMHKNL